MIKLKILRLEGGGLVMLEPTTGELYAFGRPIPYDVTDADDVPGLLRCMATDIEERVRGVRAVHALAAMNVIPSGASAAGAGTVTACSTFIGGAGGGGAAGGAGPGFFPGGGGAGG